MQNVDISERRTHLRLYHEPQVSGASELEEMKTLWDVKAAVPSLWIITGNV
jgi:hypothetical protein